ncbi:MAG TPA: DUF6483 family protein [Rectinemataceae bacterium]|nr:DUF6483 family protein [Rectinemataceae bacterium]
MSYYEDIGSFDKAEDLLYEMLSVSDSQIFALGKAFYDRLIALDDEVLKRGRLPRGEVEEEISHLGELEGLG